MKMNTYYNPEDLKKFSDIGKWNEELLNKFSEYHGKVFEDGALSVREKLLIGLAVTHVIKCAYCIDNHTQKCLEQGVTKEEMMEAVHEGAVVTAGATWVHGVQMMNTYDNIKTNTYYNPEDLKDHAIRLTKWNKELGNKFLEYYGKVTEDGALSAREKVLIGLAVVHVIKCAYCIDNHTQKCLEKGIAKEEMMEAVHTGAVITAGATLAHSVQMMNRYNELK